MAFRRHSKTSNEAVPAAGALIRGGPSWLSPDATPQGIGRHEAIMLRALLLAAPTTGELDLREPSRPVRPATHPRTSVEAVLVR